MSERGAKESYEVERRVMRGMDSFTDLSRLPEDFYRETKNLTVRGGVHETRPGSTRYGSCTFSGIAGEQHGMIFVSTIQGEWCLAHIGNGLYAAIAGSGAAPVQICVQMSAGGGVMVDLGAGAGVPVPGVTGAAVVVSDSNHPSRRPFVPIRLDFDVNGYRIYNILFRSKGGCKVVEYSEASGRWLARDPGLYGDAGSTAYPCMDLSSGIYGGVPQPAGTYRVRVSFARIVNGVRICEGPNIARTLSGSNPEYQQIELPAENIGLLVQAFSFVPPAGATHWVVECTRSLSLVGDSSFSDNGNDPTLYYEAGTMRLNNQGAAVSFIYPDLNNLSIPKPDTRNFLAIPAHDISVFSGGLLFFGGVGQSQSRIFTAGADGLSYHSEMYNPGSFIPVDEADGKVITAMEVVGDHLGVWKEDKTGVLMNRDFLSDITWRDRKIGAPTQGCVAMLTENQAAVLCHDGAFRIFNGNAYDHSLDLGGGAEISDPVRNLTERIDPATVTILWHREILYILHGPLEAREALALHAREGYQWTPWDGLTHFINALAENELKWILMDKVTGFLYEQSPLSPVYLDLDKDVIQWSRHDSALWPRNRRNSMVVEDCFLEGVFDMLTEAHFELDEQRVVMAGVGLSPLAGLQASKYQRWFKCWPEEGEELRCHSLELFLEGIGYSLHRATQYRVIEEASFGVPSLPATRSDIFAYMPAWGAPVVFYARFEQDAEAQFDFSGHRRNLSWYPGAGAGALRSHFPDMPPYGGEVQNAGAETDCGWSALSWDGMGGLGDEDGACSSSQVFEAVLARVDGSAAFLEDAQGPFGTWQIKISADGSVQFQLFTYGATTKRWQWVTAAGVVLPGSPADPYTMQACLSQEGDNMRAWISHSSAIMASVALTRSIQVTDSGYLGDHILCRGSSLYLSHFRRLLRIRTEAEARIFHNLIKGLMT